MSPAVERAVSCPDETGLGADGCLQTPCAFRAPCLLSTLRHAESSAPQKLRGWHHCLTSGWLCLNANATSHHSMRVRRLVEEEAELVRLIFRGRAAGHSQPK